MSRRPRRMRAPKARWIIEVPERIDAQTAATIKRLARPHLGPNVLVLADGIKAHRT